MTLRFSLTNCCFLDSPHFLSWYHTNSPKNGLGIFHDSSDFARLQHYVTLPEDGYLNFLSFFLFFFVGTHCLKKVCRTYWKLRVWSRGVSDSSTFHWCLLALFVVVFFLADFLLTTFILTPPARLTRTAMNPLHCKFPKHLVWTTTSNSHKMSYRMNLPLTSSWTAFCWWILCHGGSKRELNTSILTNKKLGNRGNQQKGEDIKPAKCLGTFFTKLMVWWWFFRENFPNCDVLVSSLSSLNPVKSSETHEKALASQLFGFHEVLGS